MPPMIKATHDKSSIIHGIQKIGHNGEISCKNGTFVKIS